MSFWSRLKSFFFRTEEPDPEVWPDGYEDPNMRRVIETCFKTGKPVLGGYDEDGNFSMQVLDDPFDGEKH